jgi:glycosyltransferase involved in cell wall biosynthesis
MNDYLFDKIYLIILFHSNFPLLFKEWVFYFLYCTKICTLKKIIVTVTNDLSTDQRVDKVCTTLFNDGYKVLLVGRKLKNSVPISRDYKTKRIKLLFNQGFLFYTEFNFRIFLLLFFSKKDILLSNDLDSLAANYTVSVLQNKKLVYDSHELFSEIPELVHRPFVKNFWSSIEKLLLPKLKNTYTVCKSIADFYDKRYATNFKVVRNLPTFKKIETGKLPFSTDGKKIIIYQGALNIGRGLELMIDAMEYLENYLLIIVGNGDIIAELKERIKNKSTENNVHFLGKLLPIELQKITPLADIGLSLEEDLGLNYRYALPNKIFDYIQAEIPILVSDLPEMKQIVLEYKVGEIIALRTPKSLAEQIQTMLKNDYSESIVKAKQILTWEHEKVTLENIFKNLK